MSALPPTPYLESLIELYDVLFIDQFGVLRNDTHAYPAAIEALKRVKAAGRTVVVLSNSGRSGAYNAERLVGLGFPASCLDHFVTSGDVAYGLLSGGDLNIDITPETRCLTVSSGNDTNLVKRLGGVVVDDADAADLVIISGSEAERIPLETYRALLLPAAGRGVPCICTNPDIHKLTARGLAPAAGAIADLYEELGGTVTRVGKPFLPMYEHAHALIGHVARERILCIGDSIEHDIFGANTFGADALLIRSGIHAGLTDDELADAIESGHAQVRFLMNDFA